MMTRKKRRALFYVLLGVFLCLGASVTLYAQGYRVDLSTLAIKKIGAIYIRSYPSDAEVAIDDIPVKRPFSLFGSGVLVNDLFPKTYPVTIKAQGYHDWVRNVTVEPSKVADFKYAVLVPQTPEIITTTTIAEFQIIHSEPLIESASQTIVWRGEQIGKGQLGIATADGNKLLEYNAESGTYTWFDLQRATSSPIAPLLRKAGITLGAQTTIIPDIEDSSRLIIQSAHAITLFELQTSKATTITTSSPTETIGNTIASSRSNLAWTIYNTKDETTQVVIMGKSGGAPERERPPLRGKTLKMAWNANGLLGILQDDGTLYLYEPSTHSIGTRANDAKDFVWSLNGLSLVVLEHQSVEVFSFADRGYWRLNLPDMGAISRLDWYKDNRHLIAHYPDHISFIDLDDRALENIVRVADTTKAEYDQAENSLYFIQNDQLVRLRFPE